MECDKKAIQIAILGYGVVGGGTAEIVAKQKEKLAKDIGRSVNIKYILDLRKFPGDVNEDIITDDFTKIENDDEVAIVIEAMGGVTPAYDFAKRVLSKSKSYITSNKELVCTHGGELIEIAEKNKVNFLFEAAVGGGIPLIAPLSNCMLANDILDITGILNGTTNFILTKMLNEELDYKTALLIAKELGYAESDPTADVDGFDAARKIMILASIVKNSHITTQDVEDKMLISGIRNISSDDINNATKCDCKIKLLARAIFEDDKVYLFVSPHFVPNSCLISDVNDVFNAALINGSFTGEVMFYGKGAGKLATASAIVADLIRAAKHQEIALKGAFSRNRDVVIADYKTLKQKRYIHAKTSIELATKLFETVEILSQTEDELVFVTHPIDEYLLENAKKEINIISAIRIF